MAEIERLGLGSHVLRLENDGYTIVTPDQFDGHDLSQRLLARILEVSERETGTPPDLNGGTSHLNPAMATGQAKFYALLDGEPFEQALMHEVTQAMTSYLLGQSCLLSSFSTAIRGPGTPELGLHTDMIMVPSPFPFYAQVANVFWALTDFKPEDGSTFFWPGSHKFCRRPTRAECEERSRFEAVSAPAGSLIVWHGNTWHGAGQKTSAGLRVSMPMHFCRSYFMPQENYRDVISSAAMGRNPPRFADMLGVGHPYPFSLPQPDFRRLAARNAATAVLAG
jgi:ectoine hydroxylase-related dioxygenase (phytanoyl-CoA dioxygenase family)